MANRPVGVVVVEGELGNGHVEGNVWDSVIGGDEFLGGWLGRHDDASRFN